ncbi:hypothetical protein SD71_11030 [Cohnella kolymensis]|uniref:Uncharacterized protein n=1 Tax=Cohnella kolymensis TaxID=1590652 RepID=A0ABR5A4E0_9BACL|nr:hypothetical protein SD71_11030 [Cohnella kolymensis]
MVVEGHRDGPLSFINDQIGTLNMIGYTVKGHTVHESKQQHELLDVGDGVFDFFSIGKTQNDVHDPSSTPFSFVIRQHPYFNLNIFQISNKYMNYLQVDMVLSTNPLY